MAHVGAGRYGGTASGTGGRGASGAAVGSIGGRARAAAEGDDLDHEGIDWERIAIFGAGIAIGALLGAGVSAFTIPVSGPEARRAVRRGARRMMWRSQDAWEDLRDELAAATLRRQKQLRRGRRRVRERWDPEM
jgi:hypothetical protein